MARRFLYRRFGITESLINRSVDEATARQKLQTVPRLRLIVQPPHLAIRQEEQARFEVACRKDRCAWVVSEWGFGQNGFLATALERLKANGTFSDLFHVRCETAADVDQLQTLIAQQFGMPLQNFCSLSAFLASCCRQEG